MNGECVFALILPPSLMIHQVNSFVLCIFLFAYSLLRQLQSFIILLHLLLLLHLLNLFLFHPPLRLHLHRPQIHTKTLMISLCMQTSMRTRASATPTMPRTIVLSSLLSNTLQRLHLHLQLPPTFHLPFILLNTVLYLSNDSCRLINCLPQSSVHWKSNLAQSSPQGVIFQQ